MPAGKLGGVHGIGARIKLHLAKAAGRNIDGAGEKILDFFAGKGRDVLQSLGRRGERQKQLNQELFRDVNKHIRASDKLADGQANDVRDFTAARGGRGLEVKQRLAPAAIVTRRYLFGGLLSKPMLHQPQASDE